MGNCVQGTGDNNDPDPLGVLYTDLPIGGTFENPTYCNYTTQGTPNCGGTEFMPAGNGTTACTCNGLCNAGCIRKLCKRVSFNGDPVQCCITSKKTLGKNQTCDPKYRSYTTNTCDASMDSYCSQGTNLFNNSNCVSWFNQRGDAATATLEKVCANSNNIGLPQCGCILARTEALKKFTDGTKLAVECIDNRCTNGGWKTYQMQQNPCNVVNCEMNINDLQLIANAPVGTYSASFVQQCQNQQAALASGATGPAGATGSTGSAGSTGSTGSFFSNNAYIIGIIIGIILLIVIIIVIYYMMSGSDEGGGTEDSPGTESIGGIDN